MFVASPKGGGPAEARAAAAAAAGCQTEFTQRPARALGARGRASRRATCARSISLTSTQSKRERVEYAMEITFACRVDVSSFYRASFAGEIFRHTFKRANDTFGTAGADAVKQIAARERAAAGGRADGAPRVVVRARPARSGRSSSTPRRIKHFAGSRISFHIAERKDGVHCAFGGAGTSCGREVRMRTASVALCGDGRAQLRPVPQARALQL
ncbi:hypothetical protein EVAR_27766_1 [Eumeta japonica]|uniref:Uncharacterized protein n=1 Tax=Eumeta variegata TaxID=151549 RepID=A0A4C1VDZ2_EUMVA|nr:hypothetical protein EVAR_27766_1 [Eumeta japonica]